VYENVPDALPWFLLAFGAAALVIVPAVIVRFIQFGQWKQFAQLAGLTYTREGLLSPPIVTGTYRGHPVTLYTYSRTRSLRFGERAHRTYTALSIELATPASHWVKLTRETWLRRIYRSMGMQDIQIGDPTFDPEYMIGSDSPDYVRSILNPVIRAAMLGRGRDMSVTVAKNAVYHSRPGVALGAHNLGSHLDLLVMVARRVTEIENAAWGAAIA
jgi:hypothetical protein